LKNGITVGEPNSSEWAAAGNKYVGDQASWLHIETLTFSS